MSWLDKLLGRRREVDADSADASERTTPADEADILEDEVAEARDETALRGHLPPGTG